jgi:REP element-mobilizing transposase RayT
MVQIYLYIVFSTKHRRPFLRDENLRSTCHAYLAGVCHELDCPPHIVGGVEDHVHISCRLGKQWTVPKLIGELKRSSSLWIKKESKAMHDFYWQSGYGAFSISPSHRGKLHGYILEQEVHHRRETFQEEYRRLMRKYGVEWDEQYVWD